MAKGLFITLEGGEGAGKTSRMAVLKAALEKRGHRVQVVREPGGDPFAEQLRDILKHSGAEVTPWAEAFAFCAARTNMLALQVAPALNSGTVVLSDRNYVSTMAYQGYGNGWGMAELQRLREVCVAAIQPAVPDLIVVLNVSIAVSRQRVRDRDEATDRYETRDDTYHERVLAGYVTEAEQGRLPLIDAEQSAEAVDGAIWQVVEQLLADRQIIP